MFTPSQKQAITKLNNAALKAWGDNLEFTNGVTTEVNTLDWTEDLQFSIAPRSCKWYESHFIIVGFIGKRGGIRFSKSYNADSEKQLQFLKAMMC